MGTPQLWSDNTSPDAVYESIGIKPNQIRALLQQMKTYFSRLHSTASELEVAVDQKLRTIFGQRLESFTGPNVLTMKQVEEIVRSYLVCGSLPRELFRNSKDAITKEVFTIEMNALINLIENKPPAVDPSNKRSTFEFILWHIQRLYEPDRINVKIYEGKLNKQNK